MPGSAASDRRGARAATRDFEPLPDQQLVPRWCAERFGIDPVVFAGHVFWHRPGSRLIRIAAAECAPPPGVPLDGIGLGVMRRPPPRGKPTSVFLQRFAAGATRNTYRLDEAQTARFLERQPVPIEPVDDAGGYCVVMGPDGVLGCGRVGDGLLFSEIPRAWLLDGPG